MTSSSILTASAAIACVLACAPDASHNEARSAETSPSSAVVQQVPVPQASGQPGGTESAADSNATRLLREFLAGDHARRYALMSVRYQTTFSTPANIATMLDKESYGLLRVDGADEIASADADRELILETTVEWRFEGYEGRQTCHFRLSSVRNEWRIEWFLC